MNTDCRNKLVGAQWLGRMITYAILGTVEAAVNATTTIINKFKEKT
jgi:sulfite exporter TauE/SafE